MVPALIAASAGAGVAGGILNYVESEKARGQRNKELARLEAIANAINTPDFDVRQLTPKDYELGAQFIPELASFIEERRPELVRGASPDAQAGRAAQLDALQRFRNLSLTGEDTQSQILRENALSAVARQNAGQQGAIRDRFEQRGRGGSMNELVQSLLAQQTSNQSAHQAGNDAAMAAYNTRMQAMRDSANLGGQIRDDEINMERGNANAINAWNQRMANSYNNYLQNNADIRNRAALTNLERANKIADANITQRNTSRQGYQNMINDLRQNSFNNDMSKGKLRAGVVEQGIANINQNTGERTKAYGDIFGGISKGLGAGASYANAQQMRDEDEDRDTWAANYSRSQVS